jgi:hypothetical protein
MCGLLNLHVSIQLLVGATLPNHTTSLQLNYQTTGRTRSAELLFRLQLSPLCCIALLTGCGRYLMCAAAPYECTHLTGFPVLCYSVCSCQQCDLEAVV